MSKFKHLICPICQNPLLNMQLPSKQISCEHTFTEHQIAKPKSILCSKRHTFDLAGKGYVNLLMIQDKNSKSPGDNKDMTKARKRFLDKGYYEPLALGLCNLFSQKLTSSDVEKVLFDAGCGDGYYTDIIKRYTSKKSLNLHVYGMDISKEAIRLASGRNKDIGFIVASLFKIPIESSCVDVILNAFAPSNDSEFSRVLKKDGVLLTVIPGKRHLFQLKSVLYEKPYENDEKEPEFPSFRLEEQVRIKGFIELNSREDIADLLTMTPYYWRTPREGIERLNSLDKLGTEIEFVIGVRKKQG
ncbi:MAG: putative RNA methyltransferase [Acetivibrionales bacterium]|jgi:23S rRNA (guanine745-N1)-methyltransferase